MKKLLVLLLVFLMTFGIATILTACGDTNKEKPHEHTFETTWTSDATHHYKKANCEHDSEVSEKAEHVFGDDEKCDICGYEKVQGGEKPSAPSEDEIPHNYTVTKEIWEQKTKLFEYKNFTNVVTAQVEGKEYKTEIFCAENAISFTNKFDGSITSAIVLVEKQDGIYGYNYSIEDQKYFDLTKSEEISSANFDEYIKLKYGYYFLNDLFEEFTFDSTTNEYKATLTVERKNEYSHGYTNFENDKFAVKFIDNNLAYIKVTNDAQVGMQDLITIGNAVVTIPTETIPKPQSSDDSGEISVVGNTYMFEKIEIVGELPNEFPMTKEDFIALMSEPAINSGVKFEEENVLEITNNVVGTQSERYTVNGNKIIVGEVDNSVEYNIENDYLIYETDVDTYTIKVYYKKITQ